MLHLHSQTVFYNIDKLNQLVYSKFPLAIHFTYGSIYMSILNSQFIPPFPSPSCMPRSVLYICVSTPAFEIGSSVPWVGWGVGGREANEGGCICIHIAHSLDCTAETQHCKEIILQWGEKKSIAYCNMYKTKPSFSSPNSSLPHGRDLTYSVQCYIPSN